MVEWNDTYQAYPPAQCLHHLFEAQVERTPATIAFICEGEQLTYQELNGRANQVAHYLRRLGVGVGTLVGVCLERSLDMASALLGILKAGGAYIPLDPAYPPERLAFMLQDTKTPLVLTRQALAARLPAHQAHTVCLDSDWSVIAQESDHNPVTSVTPDQPAYIVYTSGSTGTPKGVLGLHRGAVNRFRWMWELYPFESGEICCQKTTLNFVDSVWEVFGPLLQGIPTLIIPEAVVKDTPQLVAELANYRVSRTVVVPSLLQLLLDLYPDLQNRLPHLKFWVTSGEALTPELARLFRERMPHSRLINLYGSSEVSADATFYEIPADQPITCVPIGRPIANTQIYLLDPHLNLVPIGVPGELYVGGEGLAGGYLYRPELTAERFIGNPFIKQQEVSENSLSLLSHFSPQLYRTGDIARYLPDGNIEYLGRTDYQVKIRGVRIELGEIKAALAQHPAVHQVLVAAREDTPGDKRLVAYVVPQSAASQTNEFQNLPHLLRQFLQERLPEHMLPAGFVFLPTFPLTPNGKVNRQALPLPEMMTSQPNSSFVAPTTRIERELARIWETFLNVQPVGRHDNFFELGGHSLMAVRMFSQIEKTFGVNLPLTSLFKSPTVTQLARLIEQQGHITTWPSVVELQPQGSKPPFFCIHGITGDILWFRELALQLAPDQPFYGIQARGLDGMQPPFDTIEAMAAQYITEIRAFQPTGPYFLGGASFGGTVALEMSRQLLAQGQQVALLAMFDHAPPNLDGYQGRPVTGKVRQALTLLGNFPYWLNSFLKLSPADRIARLRRILKVTQKSGKPLVNHLDFDPNAFDAADLIDYAAELPEHRQRLIEAHYRAIISYRPPRFPGQVVLLRARAQSLFHTDDPAAVWQLLAAGGVDVRMIPGSHEGIFKAPHVEVLAQELRNCLVKAQQG